MAKHSHRWATPKCLPVFCPQIKTKTRAVAGPGEEESQSGDEFWSAVQQRALERALKMLPKGTDQRWEKIAKQVPEKTAVSECNARGFRDGLLLGQWRWLATSFSYMIGLSSGALGILSGGWGTLSQYVFSNKLLTQFYIKNNSPVYVGPCHLSPPFPLCTTEVITCGWRRWNLVDTQFRLHQKFESMFCMKALQQYWLTVLVASQIWEQVLIEGSGTWLAHIFGYTRSFR